MSHAFVTVCLPPTPPAHLATALDAAMAPFGDEDGPNNTWDWWYICGGHHRRFPVKPGYQDDPRVIIGEDAEMPAPGECDGGPIEVLDLTRMPADAIADAWEGCWYQQDAWNALRAVNPPARPLTHFLARHEADPDGYPRVQAVSDHHAQDLMMALRRGADRDYPGVGIWVFDAETDPLTYFAELAPDEAEVARWAIPTWALLTLDGRWIEADDGPIDGVRATDEKWRRRKADHAAESERYILSLPPDVVLVRLYYHY